MKAKRSRLIGAPQTDVWRVVSDPHHLARWWPRVKRVEAVQERKRGTGTLWTKVLETKAGRSVRADFRCLYSKEPSAYAWEQEIEGSPFAKVLRSSEIRIGLEGRNGTTMVSLEAQQRLRGLSRFGGGFMLKRATSSQLDQALDGLEHALVGDSDQEGEQGG
jgi:carbon monoxide dehydrogenase subunit G